MAFKKSKLWLVTIVLLVWALAALGGLYFWLSSEPVTPAKLKIFQIMPYPLATVGDRPILMKNFLQRYALAQKNLGRIQDAASTKQALAGQMIRETKTSILLAKAGIAVTNEDIDEEFTRLKDAAENHAKTFSQLGISEADFKAWILRPNLESIQLRTWFNGQKRFNQASYQLAESLLQRVQNGENMVALARNYTQDQARQPFGGDLGFLKLNQLNPELATQLGSMIVGQAKLLADRDGLHIIRLDNQSRDLYNFREIFLRLSGFDAWLDTQSKNITVRQYIKLDF